MEIWKAPEGHRWRCLPCDWEGEEAEFRLDDPWQPDGPALSFASCPRCGRSLEIGVDA